MGWFAHIRFSGAWFRAVSLMSYIEDEMELFSYLVPCYFLCGSRLLGVSFLGLLSQKLKKIKKWHNWFSESGIMTRGKEFLSCYEEGHRICNLYSI